MTKHLKEQNKKKKNPVTSVPTILALENLLINIQKVFYSVIEYAYIFCISNE